MAELYVYSTILSKLSCGVCAIPFAIPEDLHAAAQADGRNFTCPNGHVIAYRQTENDHLRKRVESLKAKNVASEDQRRAAVREAEALRVQILRDRQRFANGVCPCCNRSFANVRRHMTTQHPDYDATRVDVGVMFQCECGQSFESLRGLRTHQGHMRDDDWEVRQVKTGRHLTKV